MKAVYMEAFRGLLPVVDLPEPECPSDGVVVAVRACGVCRSDHHGWVGHNPNVVLPHVLGHEFAGEILEVGPECREHRVGTRVTAPFILSCGHCPDCRSGAPTVCANQATMGFSRWGAYAERMAIPQADFNLVALPGDLEFEVAAGMGCRVTTAWRALTDRARLAPGEWVAVHGCGGVGLSAVMIAAALGARVVAVDVSDVVLAKAREMGADRTLNAARVADVGEAVREMTGGGAHVSLEALGRTVTFENSLRSLRKLGRHVQIGMPTGDDAAVSVPLFDLVYARQLSILGTRGLGATGFAPLLQLVDAGRLDLSQLVTRRIPLSGAGAALEEMDGTPPAGVTVIDRFDS